MTKTRHFYGDLKLTRPVCFRLPEPEYRNLIGTLAGNRLSDLMRDIVAKYNIENTGPEHCNTVEPQKSLS